jgi:hypothetical protein
MVSAEAGPSSHSAETKQAVLKISKAHNPLDLSTAVPGESRQSATFIARSERNVRRSAFFSVPGIFGSMTARKPDSLPASSAVRCLASASRTFSCAHAWNTDWGSPAEGLFAGAIEGDLVGCALALVNRSFLPSDGTTTIAATEPTQHNTRTAAPSATHRPQRLFGCGGGT